MCFGTEHFFLKSLKHFVISAGHYHFKEEQLIENIFIRRGVLHVSTIPPIHPTQKGSIKVLQSVEERWTGLSVSLWWPILKKRRKHLEFKDSSYNRYVKSRWSRIRRDTKQNKNRFSSLVFGRKGEWKAGEWRLRGHKTSVQVGAAVHLTRATPRAADGWFRTMRSQRGSVWRTTCSLA